MVTRGPMQTPIPTPAPAQDRLAFVSDVGVGRQLLQQRCRVFQIARTEPFGNVLAHSRETFVEEAHALPRRPRSPKSNLVSVEPPLIWEYFELQLEISSEPADYFLETGARRQSPTAKTARNGASFTIAWRAHRETALAGWVGRIRTAVWPNWRLSANN